MTESEREKSFLELSPIPSIGKYMLNENFFVDLMLLGAIRTIKIPMFFKTDGGSVPRILWTTTITPFDPSGIEGFILHDYSYQKGGFIIMINDMLGMRTEKFLPMDRSQCDNILRDVMKRDRVNMFIRNKVYYGVRIGGGRAWNNYRKGIK